MNECNNYHKINLLCLRNELGTQTTVWIHYSSAGGFSEFQCCEMTEITELNMGLRKIKNSVTEKIPLLIITKKTTCNI